MHKVLPASSLWCPTPAGWPVKTHVKLPPTLCLTLQPGSEALLQTNTFCFSFFFLVCNNLCFSNQKVLFGSVEATLRSLRCNEQWSRKFLIKIEALWLVPSFSFLFIASVFILGLIHLKDTVQSAVYPCVQKHWSTAQKRGGLHNFGGLKPQNNQPHCHCGSLLQDRTRQNHWTTCRRQGNTKKTAATNLSLLGASSLLFLLLVLLSNTRLLMIFSKPVPTLFEVVYLI